MPRYFFHFHNDETTRDEEGVELPDRAAAMARATTAARSLACDDVLHGRLNLRHRIVVADEAGVDLATITFGEAVAVEG